MKKSFVSVVFFTRKLQIVQMNEGLQVTAHTTVDLPPGLVVNYKVVDTKALGRLIAGVWKQLGLTEKSVGIVVPEFSTFTKSLFLPKIENADLNEAVHWQANDFLPTTGETIMDWKIVDKKGVDYQILAVAISKMVLSGYVDAVSAAGLLPLVVETPSLSLSRVADVEKVGKLIIYANFGEAVVAITNGEEIIGSSVVASSDQNGVIVTAQRMIDHYEDLKIMKVQVGGLDFNQAFLVSLQNLLKRPVSWLNPKAVGVTPQQKQECLIGISLQLKDPVEPESELTVNLLPPDWARKYSAKKSKRSYWAIALVAAAVLWVSTISVFGVYMFMAKELARELRVDTEIPPELEKEVFVANDLATKTNQILGAYTSPQEIINLISASAPEGVSVLGYEINLDTNAIVVRGTSATREALVSFQRALEAGSFADVQIPVSSLEKESNLDFEMNFNYQTGGKLIKIDI